MNNIKTIYEDDHLLILDKPSGITVNKSETTVGEDTVQDLLERKLMVHGSWSMADEESDFYKRAGIVHRLDKETSGLLVVAKDWESFENLQAQFKERKVYKTYLALAHGSFAVLEGEIAVPVGRLPWNRKKFGVLAGGKEAITKYHVVSSFKLKTAKNKSERLTLLELNPKTGRTHQIRVHLKYFNRPIFADFLYAGRKVAREDRKILARVFLHAQKISFMHPKTGERLEFESKLPNELKQVLVNLEQDADSTGVDFEIIN